MSEVQLLEDRTLLSGDTLVELHQFTANSVQPVVVGETMFFADGGQLWKSDGTPNGTTLVHEFSSIDPFTLTAFDGAVYFSANDLEFGQELWRSDGTAEGTSLLKDIYTGSQFSLPNSSRPSDFVVSGSSLYFLAANDAQSRDLWASDGTTEGTHRILDVPTNAPSLLTDVNGTLFFNYQFFGSQMSIPAGLYRSDGTVEGTTLVTQFGLGAFSWPRDIQTFEGDVYLRDSNGTVSIIDNLGLNRQLRGYYSDVTPGAIGVLLYGTETFLGTNQLWFYDGDGDTPVPLSEVNLPSRTTTINDRFFFVAAADGTGIVNAELWTSDGTVDGTHLVEDLNPDRGTFDSAANPWFFPFDGDVVFLADDGTNGYELWRSDGTPEGTDLFVDVNPGTGSGFPYGQIEDPHFTDFNRNLAFVAFRPEGGRALYLLGDPPASDPETVVVSNTDDSGVGSLRWAIEQANASATTNRIEFNIPGSGVHTISLQSELPTITAAVEIDGWSQPGFAGMPLIELDGSATTGANGLHVTSGGSVIQGLVINRFDDWAILLQDGDANRVSGNFIGTNAAGTATLNNSKSGIMVQLGSSLNIIGTDSDGVNDAWERNLISGNDFDGIAIQGNGTSGNVVAGNLIGTNLAGTDALGGNHFGVLIGDGATGTRVGTNGDGVRDEAERNVISGNLWDGVVIVDDTTYANSVFGNFIGTDVTGTSALPNEHSGVWIVNGPDENVIGGLNGRGNLIAYNGGDGVAVHSGRANVISGNSIYSNATTQIDIGPDGMTPNDVGDADSGANNLINFPTVLSVSQNTDDLSISGLLTSHANESFTIEFFENGPDGAPGQTYLGHTTVSTDGNGDAEFTWVVAHNLAAGAAIVATATHATDGTSEFSATPIGLASTRGLDRWYATVGDEPLAVTWTTYVEESGEFDLRVTFPELFSPNWMVREDGSGNVIGVVQVDGSGATLLTRDLNVGLPIRRYVATLPAITAGWHTFTIDAFAVPDAPVVEQIEFSLVRTSLGGAIEVTENLTSLFAADHPESTAQIPPTTIRYGDGSIRNVANTQHLIELFRPILHFDVGERFAAPVSVEESLGADADNRIWDSGDTNEVLDLSSLADEQYGPESDNTAIYASVLHDAQRDEMAINYYFHYPRSNWKEHGGINTHEGDWEGATVFLRRNDGNQWEPDRIAMAQHVEFLDGLWGVDQADGGDVITWRAINRSGLRPHLFVGLGGHATYATSDITVWVTHKENHLGNLPGEYDPSAEDAIYLDRVGDGSALDWLLFPGHWGRPKSNEGLDNDGPLGPVFADNGFEYGERWYDPWSWSAGFNEVAAETWIADRVLHIQGLLNSNDIRVSPVEVGVSVDVNGTVHTFDAGDFDRIEISSPTGRDDILRITGSSEDDQAQLRALGEASTFTLDGLSISAFGFQRLTFDGAAGDDTATITGSSQDEVADIGPTSSLVTTTGPLSYSVSTSNVESHDVRGGGGTDTANLYDSGGHDTFSSDGIAASLIGPGFSSIVRNFNRVNARSQNGGADKAVMRDPLADGSFVATGSITSMTGANYKNVTFGFSRVDAIANASNPNRATLQGLNASDLFVSNGSQAYMAGTGFVNVAKGYGRVDAHAVAGNKAQLNAQGNSDLFVSNGSQAYMTNPGTGTKYLNVAFGFDRVDADAKLGATNNKAQLNAQGNDDQFVGNGYQTYITNPGSGTKYLNVTFGFNRVDGYAKSGATNNKVQFNAVGNDDQFVGNGYQAYMTNPGSGTKYLNVAFGFNRVDARAKSGATNNKAQLNAVGNDDQFVANGSQAYMTNPGTGTKYLNVAVGFNRVDAFAKSGGQNTVRFNGTTGSDIFQVQGSRGWEMGTGFLNVANGFVDMKVYSRGGADEAYFAPIEQSDSVYGRANSFLLTKASDGTTIEVLDFNYIRGTSANGQNAVEDVSSIDYVFEKVGNWIDAP